MIKNETKCGLHAKTCSQNHEGIQNKILLNSKNTTYKNPIINNVS